MHDLLILKNRKEHNLEIGAGRNWYTEFTTSFLIIPLSDQFSNM